MTVLARSELEASPLADLHTIANQVGLEGFRRLRKAELIDAILGETVSREARIRRRRPERRGARSRSARRAGAARQRARRGRGEDADAGCRTTRRRSSPRTPPTSRDDDAGAARRALDAHAPARIARRLLGG